MPGPPVARIIEVAWWLISSVVPWIVGFSRQEIRPGGMPARSPASLITRTASAVLFDADGWGATMTALRALTEISDLKIAVEVGFVDGVSATITPTGAPISTILRSLS